MSLSDELTCLCKTRLYELRYTASKESWEA